ncbi:uncharacterized protein VNE69_02039 [Vairimorpha necatrix]|uniref:Uncharacterized protein n=1 Tax=Vairimorpha necatrix TaxID=6039 RepID=A0AAX4J9E7_9MICR
MADHFTALLNSRLSKIMEKYKDVDDSCDPSIDLETGLVYDYESEHDSIEDISDHEKEFERIYNLEFVVDNFYDLYELLFE